MDDRKTFVETANDLQESFQDEIETRASVAAYYHFVQDENEKGMAVNAAPADLIDSHSFTALAPKKPSPTQKWPDFDFEMFRDTFGTLPQDDAIKSIFEKGVCAC
jgi:hypothetical protein